jgi:CBS domain-containing protein
MNDETHTHQDAPQNAAQPAQTKARIFTEEVKVSGEAAVAKVKEIIREGNIRRIIIKNESGKTLFEIPLTIGVVGALLLPQLAALGAVGALIANLTITIEREAEVGDALAQDPETAAAAPAPRQEDFS